MRTLPTRAASSATASPRSTRAAASATASPTAAAAAADGAARATTSPTAAAADRAAAAAAIAHVSAAPPPSSDSDEAAAALLVKPKPCGAGKNSAKGRADGARNTVPPAKNTMTIAAVAPPPLSYDSNEAAAAPLATSKRRGLGKQSSKGSADDTGNTVPAPARKEAKTKTAEKVCHLIL